MTHRTESSPRRSRSARFVGAVWLAGVAVLVTLAVPARGEPPTAARGLPAAASRPNVVIILADDLGYGDVQCYNPARGKVPTPRLDRLAAEGLRFTDGHSSSGVCSPSRYALLTGRYHWRSRLQAGIVGYLEGPLIAPDRLTVAGLLREHGYHTACVGKWHLGWEWSLTPQQKPLFTAGRGNSAAVTDAHRAAWREVYSRPIGGGPTTRGFDAYFGTDVPNWPPYCFLDGDRTVGLPEEFLPAALLGGGKHLASIGGPALKDWKLEAILPALVDRACEVIRTQTAAGKPFLLYLPLTTPHTPLAVNAAWQGRSGLGLPVADLIMETDAAVGRVLDALAESGAADNTLVLFSSDNGFAAYTGAKQLEAQGHFPSGPLRGYKTDAFEGGHRVPFLIRWPAVVAPGRVSDQLVHQADVLATVAEIVGHPLPPTAGEDSHSLLPILRGDDRPVRRHAISHAASGLASIRLGPWKLIAGGGAAPGQGQLYNLAEDLGETRNLWEAEPARVAELLELMDRLVSEGRSTPGPRQANDVPVRWRRFLEAPARKS